MPHLTLEYSANLDGKIDLDTLCGALNEQIAALPFFEVGAIRVRAVRCASYAIADQGPLEAFIDMQFRIGKGRSQAEKKAAGDALFAVASKHASGLLAEPHFALSLEIREIDSDLSWRKNTMHSRLRNRKAAE